MERCKIFFKIEFGILIFQIGVLKKNFGEGTKALCRWRVVQKVWWEGDKLDGCCNGPRER